MKIAVLHSFMDNIGGAEMVSLTLARELGADVYTTNISERHIENMGFGDVLPRMHSIGRIPIRAPFRHQAAFWKFRRLNLGKAYDLYIICGDWAMSAAVNHSPNLWYVHSPLNELWEFKDYVKDEIVRTAWKKPLFEIWARFNRMLSRRYARHVNTWVCNSENARARVKKYYGKEPVVINPPVYTKKYRTGATGDYWLSVNRIMRPKRIEIQMDALSRLPSERLIIVGSYEKGAIQFEGYKGELAKIRPKNVTVESWVSQDRLLDLYANAKGLLATAIDEDFGMSAVEAMASGKPVIAADRGGYRETVIDGVTGTLIKDINGAKLADAMKKISREMQKAPSKYERACRDRAAEFDTAEFIKKIKKAASITP